MIKAIRTVFTLFRSLLCNNLYRENPPQAEKNQVEKPKKRNENCIISNIFFRGNKKFHGNNSEERKRKNNAANKHFIKNKLRLPLNFTFEFEPCKYLTTNSIIRKTSQKFQYKPKRTNEMIDKPLVAKPSIK